ncbi:MAG: hypothetical protein PVJ63_09690 [Thioalkalispiraceae bacterium]|jgi:hypothetical protein
MNIELYTRHNEVPILRQHDSKVNASYYNHVQVALHRLGEQIRFRIPGLKHLDLILQKDAWIVVDRVLNDLPVVGWTNFQVAHRENLHEPIKCEIRYWHAAATMIKARTLEAMEMLLGEELADKITNNEIEEAVVVPFRSKRKE